MIIVKYPYCGSNEASLNGKAKPGHSGICAEMKMHLNCNLKLKEIT